MTDLSLWDGDGLPEYDEWRDIVNDLDMTTPEIEAWIGACKQEAWVRERMARYTDEKQEYNLATARYFWRRVDALRRYHKRLDQELDHESEAANLETRLASFMRGECSHITERFETHEEGEAWRAQVRQHARACGVRVRTGRADDEPMTCWAWNIQTEVEA